MTNDPQLALAYISKSPESAGRVLSSLAPEAAAAFLEEIPVADAVKLVAHLQPIAAARITPSVDGKVLATIFRDLDLGKSSAIVRQMDRTTRSELLSKLSKRTRTVLEKSLSFVPGTVGAYMTTNVATLLETDNVATALDIIRQSDHDHIDVVFVLSDVGSLAGVVTSATALRHSESLPLSAILDTSCRPVSAHSGLQAIADPALWHDFTYLPVVNRQRKVIGAIARKMLKTERLSNQAAASAGQPSLPSSIFATFAATSAGLFDLVATSLNASAQRGDADDR